MVRASGQIEQDLRALQDKTEVMESALDPLYEGYLKALAKAGQRQLMMAAYYLCTQAYPDKFLSLSWDSRNQLQQSLQALSNQIQVQLNQQRDEARRMSRRPQNADGLAFLQRLLEARMSKDALGKQRGGSRSAEEALSLQKQGRSTSEMFSEEDFIPNAEEETAKAEEMAKEIDEADTDDADLDGMPLEGDELEDGELRDNALSDRDLEESAFDISVLDDNEAIEAASANIDRVRDAEDYAENDTDAEAAFEMEVPAADERLSVNEEEDLLAALEGLARRSMEVRGRSQSSRDLSASETGETGEDQLLTPMHLMKQQMLMERSIREVFKTISEEANDLLQKANVMPSFPRSLLAAATESSDFGEPANAVPNVVRVSVRVMHGEGMLASDDEGEMERDQTGRSRDSNDERIDDERIDDERSDTDRIDFEDTDAENRERRFGKKARSRQSGRYSKDQGSMRRRLSRSSRRDHRQDRRNPRAASHDVIEIEALPELAAIRLRLSEVEFTDPTVSAWRSKLRQKLSELKQLGLRYKQTQRSLEIAQAEDAWRSSWTVQSSDRVE